jgi:MFS family permease
VVAALTGLQFFFALTWIVYVIYLPALALQAGIDKSHVPWILMMDQLIFIACDAFAGVYADRLSRVMGRIGGWMAAVTVFSCVAFLALPWIAPAAGATAFLALTALWSATSSALRAPPMALASRRAERSQQPWIAGFYVLGLGIAAAIAPYLGLTLKGVDPRVPFAVASLGLAVFAVVVARIERGTEAPRSEEVAAGAPAPAIAIALFALAALLLGVGFQIHSFVASSPGYLRFASAEQLPYLTPVFWIGFNLAVLPASVLLDRFSGATLMAVGGGLGVVSLAACGAAGSLESLIVAQAAAGIAWAVALTSAMATGLALGRAGREGLVTGLLYSMLAAAAVARLGLLASGAAPASTSETLPMIAWVLAAVIAVAPMIRRR